MGDEILIHIAGPDVRVDDRLRQRCAWCGTTLIDYALDRIAVPVDTDPTPAVWPVGALVGVYGYASYIVDHDANSPLPEHTCAALDAEVTA